jgi:hypothetical protein
MIDHPQSVQALQGANPLEAKESQGEQSIEGPDHLLKFKQAVTQPLHTPMPKLSESSLQQAIEKGRQKPQKGREENMVTSNTSCSPRIQNKMKKCKSSIKLAQKVLARKWAILDVDKELEELTLQQYINIYIKTLPQPAIMAVKKLTEVANMKNKKKREASKNNALLTPTLTSPRKSLQ